MTGASSGIGRAVAASCAARGDRVVGTSRSGTLGDAPLSGVIPGRLELTDPDSADALVADVIASTGRLDVLVANAGRGFTGTTEQLTVADFRSSLEINFLGQVHLVRAALPVMRAAGGGRIVAVSSLGGVLGQPFQDAYCAAKFALEGWLESLHAVAAAGGVRISVVEPGAVEGSFRDHAFFAPVGPDPLLATLRERYDIARAAARFQTAGEIADVITALLDDPAPAFRHQTSKTSHRLVGRKLADTSGEAVTAMTAAWISAPSSP